MPASSMANGVGGDETDEDIKKNPPNEDRESARSHPLYPLTLNKVHPASPGKEGQARTKADGDTGEAGQSEEDTFHYHHRGDLNHLHIRSLPKEPHLA